MNQIGLVEIAGIGVVLLFFIWMILFFQIVRPRLMEWVGNKLDVRVRESAQSLDSGTYEVVGTAPLAKHGAIVLIDFIVLLVGTVGFCALISIPAFLIGESGLPYRLEGILLKQGVTIVSSQIPPLQDDASKGIVMVQNESDSSMSACRVSVADYQASNGYLTGATQFFDMTPQELRYEPITLSAINARPGTYEIRLSLECGNRLKEKVRAEITVQ